MQDSSEFIFTEEKGELRPLETRKVNVDFFPQECKSVRTFFELTVSDGGQPRYTITTYNFVYFFYDYSRSILRLETWK